MEALLDEYSRIVGDESIDELKMLAERLKGKIIQNVNSTAVGGGVAEILHRVLPLFKELGIDVHWDIIKGGESFFEVTKKIHNALHGHREFVGEKDFKVFREAGEENLRDMEVYGDIAFIHDPQPIFLIHKKKNGKTKIVVKITFLIVEFMFMFIYIVS